MDPVTALGVASSVVQLVDFTQGLFRSTYEIYKSASGRTETHINLQSITASLKTLTDNLARSVERATPAPDKEPSNHDAELLTLCQKCRVVAEKLSSALEGLSTQKAQSFWHSFGVALHTVWKKREIELLENELETFRQQISLQINVYVRYSTFFLFNGLANRLLVGNRSIAHRPTNPVTVNSSLHRSKRLKT
jgi:hypothetical protein